MLLFDWNVTIHVLGCSVVLQRVSVRLGCIGAITPDDMKGVVQAMDQALREIGINNREAFEA